ncbi:MAG: molybdopterin synthase sulfur carrier subunit [Candidatus Cloacimonadota bacterium]|nr:MAG: molybdopterin synthase sulfur carrier subunit [Candidatus Cloacimonadota bacterium]
MAKMHKKREDMKIRLEYFAIYRDLLGKSSEDLELSESISIKDLFLQKTDSLKERDELLESTVFAVNSDYEDSGYMIQDGDEIVFIPPVSGG